MHIYPYASGAWCCTITPMATANNKQAPAPKAAPATTTTPTTVPFAYPGAHADTPAAYVRYARTLKANGHQVAAYNLLGKVPSALAAQAGALAQAYPNATYVVCNHTTGAHAGFATWAPAYAYSMAQAHTALAPSVVGSLGKQGLGSVPVAGLSQRAPGAPAQAAPVPST